MMDKNKITFLSDGVIDQNTGETLEAVTLVVDGQIRKIFDIMLIKDKKYTGYTELVKELLFFGINHFMEKGSLE